MDLGCAVFPPTPHVVTEGSYGRDEPQLLHCPWQCSMWGPSLFCLRHDGQGVRALRTKTLKGIRGDCK